MHSSEMTGLNIMGRQRYGYEVLSDRRNNELRFDKSINLGNIVSLIALLITLFAFGTKILERMDNMELKVNMMWEQFSLSYKK